jgi:hypothetical protein
VQRLRSAPVVPSAVVEVDVIIAADVLVEALITGDSAGVVGVCNEVGNPYRLGVNQVLAVKTASGRSDMPATRAELLGSP